MTIMTAPLRKDVPSALPKADGEGQRAVVRVIDAAGERFLQIDVAESGVTVSETGAIDPCVLKLAQASVEVFRRIDADDALRKPLAAGH
jgi:hypothetical protein